MTPHIEPFTMCCRKECTFRVKSNEVSIFEATEDTVHQPPSKRRLDPNKAVKKYRRSAAGTSKDQQYPARSLGSLFLTVEYLANLFLRWETSCGSRSTVSLLDLVNFLEDRLRAVQVDLVVSQMASKELQFKMAKLHIIVLYILSDSPKYERRHGMQALQTALSSYWNQDEDGEEDDAILAVTTLVQLNDDLCRVDAELDSDIAYASGIMSVYRKHVGRTGRNLSLLRWSLLVTTSCNLGEWANVLSLLNNCGGAFGVLARGCMAPSLSRLRAKALQAYNVSLMKGERLRDTDVARLLVIEQAATAAEFCRSLDLPVEDEMVSFKTAPINLGSVSKKERRDDSFVFRKGIQYDTDRENLVIPTSLALTDLI